MTEMVYLCSWVKCFIFATFLDERQK